MEVNLKIVKEKCLLILEDKYVEGFNKYFESEFYDMVENPDDFFAEGVVSHFMNNIIEE